MNSNISEFLSLNLCTVAVAHNFTQSLLSFPSKPHSLTLWTSIIYSVGGRRSLLVVGHLSSQVTAENLPSFIVQSLQICPNPIPHFLKIRVFCQAKYVPVLFQESLPPSPSLQAIRTWVILSWDKQRFLTGTLPSPSFVSLSLSSHPPLSLSFLSGHYGLIGNVPHKFMGWILGSQLVVLFGKCGNFRRWGLIEGIRPLGAFLWRMCLAPIPSSHFASFQHL